MKGLPEKLMLAAIILSCGFVAHLDSAAPERAEQNAAAGGPQRWQLLHGAAVPGHAVKVTKAYAAEAEVP